MPRLFKNNPYKTSSDRESFYSIVFFLIGQPRPLFHLFSVFSNKQYNFYNKSMCKKCHVHPVYSARIRTHDLRNVSLLPVDVIKLFLGNLDFPKIKKFNKVCYDV